MRTRAAHPALDSHSDTALPPDLRGLSEQISHILARRHSSAAVADEAPAPVLLTPAGPQLARGIIHEWFGPTPEPSWPWFPPLTILAHLAAASLESTPGHIVWIGRNCWPTIAALTHIGGGQHTARCSHHLLRRSVFIDPPDARSRIAAIDLALRCPAVTAIIADGRSIRMPDSRRLQVAAAGRGGLAMLARPLSELAELSAAAARWLVRCIPSPTERPRWDLQLLRCKGVQLSQNTPHHHTHTSEAPRSWTVEWNHAARSFVVPALMAREPGEEARGGTGVPPVLRRIA